MFKHILNGLLALHNSGVVHRDIKLENIMIRRDTGMPVIIDLGFAAPASGDGDDGYFEDSYCGSLAYMAPELHQRAPYKGTEVDIFALGVCLFIMVVGKPPFPMASSDNKLYKVVAAGEKELFWEFSLRYSRPIIAGISKDLKDLIISML